ncbi:MAG: hypothetical protein OXE58_02805 [Acidobacteria bacterium]|nr:hypothetical protein [Acidobacteriota bacterium]
MRRWLRGERIACSGAASKEPETANRRQGREIAMFRPLDPESRVPNAPMVWGPQPYKGHIYLSDMNSGLWAVKLVDAEPINMGEPESGRERDRRCSHPTLLLLAGVRPDSAA